MRWPDLKKTVRLFHPTDPVLAARPEAIKQLASGVSERVAVMDRDFNVIYANESAWSEGTSRWYIKPETQEGVRFFGRMHRASSSTRA